MDDIPALDDQIIGARVGEQSFRRGEQYFLSGAIYDARRQGATLKARCHGSSGGPYRLEVTFDARGIAEADCSCPVGDGGHCKHVAALLLAWRERPKEFVVLEELDAALERRSKAELIALIKQMLRRQPELDVLLETPLPTGEGRHTPVDPAVYRRQAAAVFHNAGYGYEWGGGVDIAGLEAIVEIGDGFVEQGDYAHAAAVYQAVSDAVLEHYETVEDEGGDLAGVVQSCVNSLGGCLLEQPEDAIAREAILRTLFEIWRGDVEAGGVGLGDQAPAVILEHATAEERRTVAAWVREALPKDATERSDWYRTCCGGFLLDLERDTLDDESFLQVCRETGLIHDLLDRLLALGRLDEAAREVAGVGDRALVPLTDIFVRQGHAGEAERIVEERAKTTTDVGILNWLQERYLARGDAAAALGMAERIFRMHPSLRRYQEVRELAQQTGSWESLRPALHAALDRPEHKHVLVQVYLDEAEIDRALDAVRGKPAVGSWYFPGQDLRLEVAKAAEETRPAAALEIYREQAEALIAHRGRENYQVACRHLLKVRALHERLGEGPVWTSYLAGLRERTRSLRALKEEMAAARL